MVPSWLIRWNSSRVPGRTLNSRISSNQLSASVTSYLLGKVGNSGAAALATAWFVLRLSPDPVSARFLDQAARDVGDQRHVRRLGIVERLLGLGLRRAAH